MAASESYETKKQNPDSNWRRFAAHPVWDGGQLETGLSLGFEQFRRSVASSAEPRQCPTSSGG